MVDLGLQEIIDISWLCAMGRAGLIYFEKVAPKWLATINNGRNR